MFKNKFYIKKKLIPCVKNNMIIIWQNGVKILRDKGVRHFER